MSHVMRKPVFVNANNKAQISHPRSLINAFVIPC